MAEGRCHSCKHWQTAPASEEEFSIGPILPLDPGWGWCRNVKYENPSRGNIARVVVDCDYADSAPYLVTRSEFGCVDHEQETIVIGGVEVPLDRDPRVPPGTMILGAEGHPVVIRDVGIGGGFGPEPVEIHPDERVELTVERPPDDDG